MWIVEFDKPRQIRYITSELELMELIARLLQRNSHLELRIRRVDKPMRNWVLRLKVECPVCGECLAIQGSTDGSLEDRVFCPKCGRTWTLEEFEELCKAEGVQP